MNSIIHLPYPSLNYMIWTAVPIVLVFVVVRIRTTSEHWSHTVMLIGVALEAFWAVSRTLCYYVFQLGPDPGSALSIMIPLMGVVVHPISGVLILIAGIGFRIPERGVSSIEPSSIAGVCRKRVDAGHQL